MPDQGPKSAFELAMEKLKSRDRAEGVEEARPPSEEQKRRIGEIRTTAQAKLAEIEILWRSKRAGFEGEPDAFEKLEREYVLDRKRIEERAESEVNKIRQGK